MMESLKDSIIVCIKMTTAIATILILIFLFTGYRRIQVCWLF